MVKVLDDSNVHHFWGLSPAVDLLDLVQQSRREPDSHADQDNGSSPQAASLPANQASETPMSLLQLGSCDCRHTVYTLCRSARHATHIAGPVRLYVYEEEPEALARHLLLISILLDDQLTVRDRVETFLEVHSNALLQEKTAEYLEACSRSLEEEVMQQLAGSAPPGSLFDLSMLKISDADKLAETLPKYHRKVNFDMKAAWQTRCRKFYEDRFDFRRNAVDWDYSMRLAAQGTPGADPALGSIIHAHHFRHWRETGVAYELRECRYSEPNRSLLSTAYGRTKEFKDRNGEDRGRSVAAWGFWADILNSPYHSFGTACEEVAFYAPSNKQFKHTSLDVAQHNVRALIHELRTGEVYRPDGQGEGPSRAPAAFGPTSMEDLEQQAEKRSKEAEAREPASDAAPSSSPATKDQTRPQQCSSDQGKGEHAGMDSSPADTSSGQEGVTGGESQAGGCIAAVGGSIAQHQSEGSSAVEDAVQATQDAVDRHAKEGAQEAGLDAAARQRCARFRILPLTGDLHKQLTGRAKFAGAFAGIAVGARHIHLLDKERGLAKVAAPGAVVAVENAKYMLQLNKEQVQRFEDLIVSKATEAGWQHLPQPICGVTAAHTVFQLPWAAEHSRHV